MRNRVLIIGAMSVALCSALVQAAPQKLNFCTGGEGGFYEELGAAIGRNIVKGTDAELVVLNTGGSVDNAELLKDGDCDIAVMQADAVVTQPLPPDTKVVDAHTEYVFWMFGKNGVDDFGKMEQAALQKKYTVATVAGSGAQVTIKHWIETDDDYKNIVPVEFDDWYQAAEAVAQGFVKKAGVNVEIAGMLYIGRAGKITSDITEDFGQQITIGEVNDASFANAKDANDNPLYIQCAVGNKEASGLKVDTIGSADTYCLRAQIVYNTAWHQGDRKLRRSVDKGINSIVKAVR